jgi:hypothetical protein
MAGSFGFEKKNYYIPGKVFAGRNAMHFAQALNLAMQQQKLAERFVLKLRRSDVYEREWLTGGIAATLLGSLLASKMARDASGRD